jgi:hypothetical protein
MQISSRTVWKFSPSLFSIRWYQFKGVQPRGMPHKYCPKVSFLFLFSLFCYSSYFIFLYSIKVKVKVAIEQAMKTQRESRGIALLFHDHGTRRRGGVSVTPRPLFTPGIDSVPIVQEAGWTPKAGLDGCRESRPPHRDSIPGPSSP